jgi:murein DD-endopeptidase MepM/ murein hydrolase activator NlpD
MKHTLYEWGIGAICAGGLVAGLSIISGMSEGTIRPEAALPDARAFLTTLTSADQLADTRAEEQKIRIRRDDTLVGLLNRIGVSREEANQAVFAASELLDMKRVRAGDTVTAWIERGPSQSDVRLMGLSLRPEAERQILIARTTAGDWRSHELRARLTPGVRRIEGVVQESIYTAALANGAGDQQVVDFAGIFGYDIDFQREIRTGDAFEIFYEVYADERGMPVKSGEVLFADFKGAALTKRFYRYTPSDDGNVDYFDETGQSAKKFLMKTPINGARLSSSFGNRRHPILGYDRLHKGTDFAAPRGTPIFAAGHGVIDRIGPNGAYGNFIRIRHANGYDTAYAHLNGFAKGMKRGARVRQGQVIGYVGTTGRSTGPHLHYEVYVNGRPVNAMSLKLPTGRKLEGEQLEAFLSERDRIEALRLELDSGETLLASTSAGPVDTPAIAASAPDMRGRLPTPAASQDGR